MTNVTLTFRADDIEHVLRQAANDAAKYSAYCDHLTKAVGNQPSWAGMSFPDRKKEWLARFLKAKRIVEAFGVEYEQTSEEETLTVGYHHVGGKTKVMKIPGIGPVGYTTGSQPDYKHPYPSYRGGIHSEACIQAADRVVRRWREALR